MSPNIQKATQTSVASGNLVDNVTQNTHFDDLFYSLSLLLTHYATYFLNIGDEFPHQKTMLVSPNIENATQT